MKKRDLKEQNKDLEINVIDLIAKFDPSDTGKYTRFLVDILKEKLEESKSKRNKNLEIRLESIEGGYPNRFKYPSSDNELEEVLISYLSEVYSRDNIENLFSFEEHLKNNRIPKEKRDINQYKNWGDIAREVSMATIKQREKLREKEVLTVLDNPEWLVIRPLTFESSLTYGSGTKWCTASRGNREYFYRYSGNGVLCYVISKINGEKFGFFYDQNEQDFSIWNAPDRRIDSMESGISFEVLSFLFNYMKLEKTNYYYFSENEKVKYEKYFGQEKVAEVVPIEQVYDMDITEIRHDYDGDFINDDGI